MISLVQVSEIDHDMRRLLSHCVSKEGQPEHQEAGRGSSAVYQSSVEVSSVPAAATLKHSGVNISVHKTTVRHPASLAGRRD